MPTKSPQGLRCDLGAEETRWPRFVPIISVQPRRVRGNYKWETVNMYD